MRVSTRHTLVVLAMAASCGAAFAAGDYGGGSAADAGGTAHHIIRIPGVHTPMHHVTVQATNAVTGDNVAIANTGGGQTDTVLTSGVVMTSQPATIIVRGRGGFFAPATPVAPSVLNDLTVDGAEFETQTVTETVPTIVEECVDRVRTTQAAKPVQAVCIDDKGTPHPASRLNAAGEVPQSYFGEVFRCMAGTSMQVTVGEYADGFADFSEASTFSCAKGEALVHRPGGDIACARQTAQRNCNERSLLRRHGPGVKLVNMSRSETYCEPSTRTVMERVTRDVTISKPLTGGELFLNGGVGQGVQ